MAKYRVLTGIDYPPNKRAEAGQVVEDLPAQAIKWLLESGLIEDASKPTSTPTEEPKPPAPVAVEAEIVEPEAEQE